MKTLFILLGPTGVGKTELSLSLAEKLSCPILNCDSRQLFGDLHIGTASPTASQLQRVQHYFVGTLNIDDYYSAAQYETDALKLLDELFLTHDSLLLSGGSMMYIDAVCKGIDDIPTIDDQTRAWMKQRLEIEGLELLVEELKQLDPEYYNIVDKKNTRRVVHALEICHMTGKTYTSYRTQVKKSRPFHIVKIGLDRPREELFARINTRVDDMMKQGLLDEVRQWKDHRDTNAMNTVGYKELLRVLDGEWELPMAVERIKKNTRVYAKKQLTWFRRDPNIHWFHPSQVEDINNFIREKLTY